MKHLTQGHIKGGYNTETDFSHYWMFSKNVHMSEIRTQTLKFKKKNKTKQKTNTKVPISKKVVKRYVYWTLPLPHRTEEASRV